MLAEDFITAFTALVVRAAGRENFNYWKVKT
jgi:hypothetical protein